DKEEAKINKGKQKEVGEEGAEIDNEMQKEVSKEETEIDKRKQKEINLSLISEEETSRILSCQESNISTSDINNQDPNIDDNKIIEILANTEIFLQHLLELEKLEELEDQKKEGENN
ncbi:9841_t:CDS:2, partial [Racocetra fulgida]